MDQERVAGGDRHRLGHVGGGPGCECWVGYLRGDGIASSVRLRGSPGVEAGVTCASGDVAVEGECPPR